MKLKHIQSIFIIAFLFILFPSGTGVTEVNKNVSKMVIDQMFHYYGDVTKGDVLSHSFVVKNEWKGDLNIKSAKPDWGFSVARYDRVIPPGNEGKVELEVLRSIISKDKKDTRINSGQINIITNDKEMNEITIPYTIFSVNQRER